MNGAPAGVGTCDLWPVHDLGLVRAFPGLRIQTWGTHVFGRRKKEQLQILRLPLVAQDDKFSLGRWGFQPWPVGPNGKRW